MSSCSREPSPAYAARQIKEQKPVVFSYNDQATLSARVCAQAGPLPARAQRALNQWLKSSTREKVSYLYPQYYITFSSSQGHINKVWAICSDAKGNMTGVFIPKYGNLAWDVPFSGYYELYVCKTASRDGLGRAIMESLADAGYDSYRIDARKARGLKDAQYLISKPAAAPVAVAPVVAEEVVEVTEVEPSPAADDAPLPIADDEDMSDDSSDDSSDLDSSDSGSSDDEFDF